MTEYIATVTAYGRGQRQVSLTEEEIVRCRECVHRGQLGGGIACMLRADLAHRVEPHGYCDHGERRAS